MGNKSKRLLTLFCLLSFLIIGELVYSLHFVPKAYAGTETISFSSTSSVTTASGFVGDTTNTVFLSGGTHNVTYTIYWASTGTGTTVTLGTCKAGTGGTCSLAITIPHSSMGNWIIHDNNGTTNGANTLTFTVNPKITGVSPTTGSFGTSVTLSGTGFAAESVTGYFGATTSYPLGSATPTSGAGGTNGDLSIIGTVSAMPVGSYSMRANGTTSGNVTSTSTFTMSPTISLSSTSGAWGSTTTISGNGFAASSVVTILEDGTATATTGISDANGSFSGVVFTPTGVAGAHTIAGRDASSNTSANVTYTMSPAITISSTSGNPGATTNVSGNGFAANSGITILEDGATTTTTGTANASGSFTNIVFTPTGAAGNHTISAKDASANTSAALTYTINGSLSLTAPSSVTLSTVTLAAPQPSGSGSMGTMQVADSRGTNVGWSLTATSTNFGDVNPIVLVAGSHNTVTSGGKYDFQTGGTYTLTINNGGSVGHSTFNVTGLETASNITTGTNIAIGTRGVTATFNTATYSVGDSWSITVYTIPLNAYQFFTVNPNNGTFTVVSGSGTGVSVGSSHGFTSNTDAATIMTATSGNGNGTYTVNPSLSLLVPAGTYTGNYSATITETVQ